jgi:hypothetical protein
VLLLCDADGSEVRSLLPVDGLKIPSSSSSSSAPASTVVVPVAAPQAALDATLNIGNSDKMNATGDFCRESNNDADVVRNNTHAPL